MIPERPGFFARLFGGDVERGHSSVSCAGKLLADGSLTGCHRPESGFPGLLVEDLGTRPVDEFCGRCHGEQRSLGRHHPSYLFDKDQDGVADSLVRPAAGQEIYTAYAPEVLGGLLAKYPDAIVRTANAEGQRVLRVAMPLETIVEVVDGQPVTEADIVTCSTCHNPHYGYLVGVMTEEEGNRELLARETGDGLLRLRDYDNTLCDACH